MVIWLFYMANSTTSTICFVIGSAIFLISKSSKVEKNPKLLFRFIFLFAVVWIGVDMTFDIQETLYSILGKDKTLTGRSDIWQDVLSINTNPFIGTGYDSFWLGERLKFMWEKHWWKPTGSHNGYLETYLNLGLIGLLLIGCIIISAHKTMVKNCYTNYKFCIMQLSIILVTITYNFTEVAFKGSMLVWFVFMLFIIKGVPLLQWKNNDMRIKNARKKSTIKTKYLV